MAQKGLARVGDTAAGTCRAPSHTGGSVPWTGTFTSGSGGFTITGQDAIAVGDVGDTSCGHHFRVIGGSGVLTGGLLAKVIARQGDPVEVIEGGTGTITSGSSIVTSE
jgi:hypothetical protein